MVIIVSWVLVAWIPLVVCAIEDVMVKCSVAKFAKPIGVHLVDFVSFVVIQPTYCAIAVLVVSAR